mgnify:CR=1 FL=1
MIQVLLAFTMGCISTWLVTIISSALKASTILEEAMLTRQTHYFSKRLNGEYSAGYYLTISFVYQGSELLFLIVLS